MNIPPRMTPASTARLAKVTEAADAAVDDGAQPAEALAKAARDYGLPVSHVPIAVRAFNTGRAVRQLSESDPWAKAASHPTATVDAVISLLDADAPTVKAAADYDRPPHTPTVDRHAPRFVASVWTKEAAARLDVKPSAPPRKNDYLTIESKAAAALDALRDVLWGVTPTQYAAVKAAAAQVRPDAVAVIDYVASYDQRVARTAEKAAATKPDLYTTTTHPAVGLAAEIAALRAAYTPPSDGRPLGYQKAAKDTSGTWFELRPDVPILDLEPPAKAAVAEPVVAITVPDEKTANVFGDYLSRKATGQTNRLGRGFQQTFVGPLAGFVNNPLNAPFTDVRGSEMKKELGKQKEELSSNLDILTRQTNVQGILSDPRLMHSDPRTVIETQQTLSQLAPNVMSNQSVAADLIHRRLQTGPLSAFDLKQLLDMEKAYVTSRVRPQREAMESEKDEED